MSDSTALTTDVLIDAFTRVAQELPSQLEGLSGQDLLWRPTPQANPIGWLAWHLTRVQDDHLAGVGGVDQQWTKGWSKRFDLPYDESDIGYGQSSEQVGKFSISDPALLVGYHAAVQELTVEVLRAMTSTQDYERVVDRHWDPPVTAAARLVSVIGDIDQHLGQLAYVRGMLAGR